jgi:Zn-dependent membrane protease YugP
MYFGDWTWIIVFPALILAMYAQSKVNSTFHQYLREYSRSGKTGAQVARELLDSNGLHDVPVEVTPGSLTDHYDPRSRTLRLSSPVYQSSSLAALGVAAHETGHALQHADNYVPLGIRNNIFPIAAFGSRMAFPLFFMGLIFRGPMLMDLGILLFTAALLFQVITLPVEYNASKRAMALLTTGGYLVEDEAPKARAVLDAAALTYVAATAVAVMQLLRLLVLRGRRD